MASASVPLSDEFATAGTAFGVYPITNCPHLAASLSPMLDFEITDPCLTCGHKGENWVCLSCSEVYCSRYVSGHMVDHHDDKGTSTERKKHQVCFSFSDASFWCYECESYITHPTLRPILQAVHKAKFGTPLPPLSRHDVGVPEDTTELFDSDAKIASKAAKLVAMIQQARHVVVYTGAGISTSARIPDYRGPNGVWTLRDRGESVKMDITLEEALPTRTHMAIKALVDAGIAKQVVSTNVDGLHRRSGLDTDHLSELHGNIYRETCEACGREYLRLFDTTGSGVASARTPPSADTAAAAATTAVPTSVEGRRVHRTGRRCTVADCGGHLCDTIIHFGENLPEAPMLQAIYHSQRSDLSLVLGTSMRVSPACDLPCYGVEHAARGLADLVICNLQPTPKDGRATLRVYARTDTLMEAVMAGLGIPIPDFAPDTIACRGQPDAADSSAACEQ